MIIEVLRGRFSVCRLENIPAMPKGTVFFARTDNEISIVCETDAIDFDAQKREDGWRCMRVQGELDFALIGILAEITAVLAKAGVSVFCVSTYDTDYVLVKEEKLETALDALSINGYEIKNVCS